MLQVLLVLLCLQSSRSWLGLASHRSTQGWLGVGLADWTTGSARGPRRLLETRLFGRPTPSREYQKGDGGVRRPAANVVPINKEIKADTVRVIAPGNETDEDGIPNEIMLGIYPLAEALAKAEEYELDLVLINDKGDPPVCKIIDYGKFKYSLEKKKKENAKKQVKSEIKEVKMSYKIDDHDFDVRVRAVQRFIADGDRVKVVVVFKGREMQFKDLGKELLDRIYAPVQEIAVLEAPPKVEGRSYAMMVGPKQK